MRSGIMIPSRLLLSNSLSMENFNMLDLIIDQIKTNEIDIR